MQRPTLRTSPYVKGPAKLCVDPRLIFRHNTPRGAERPRRTLAHFLARFPVRWPHSPYWHMQPAFPDFLLFWEFQDFMLLLRSLERASEVARAVFRDAVVWAQLTVACKVLVVAA